MKKTVFMGMMICIGVWAISGTAQAVVSFSDTFESQTPGALGGSPEVGYLWSELSSGVNTVVAGVGIGGSQGLEIVRGVGVGAQLRGLTNYEEGRALPGNDLIFTQTWLRTDTAQFTTVSSNWGYSTYNSGWFASPSNTYRYWNTLSSSYVDTGVVVGSNVWETVEMVLHLVDSGTPDWSTGTWDLWLTSAATGNVRTKIAGDIPLGNVPSNSYTRFYISNQSNGVGPVTTYWDDISVERKNSAYCGDDAHPYPTGDFNEDCSVDLADLAVIVQNWLRCEDVVCP